jgi:Flp pilus assembly pilin Flp
MKASYREGMETHSHISDSRESGASMVEYALLIVLIAIIAFVAVTLAGEELSAAFSDIASSVDAAN